MGVYLVHVGPVDVASSEDKGSRNVALVLEEHALEEGAGGDDAGLGLGGHSEELELGGDELGGLLSVCSSSSTAAVNIGSHVVDLFAVLVAHRGVAGSAGVRTEDNATLENCTNNSGSGLG